MELPRVPFSDWELRPQDVKICMRPDGRKWEIGSGAFGQVCGITRSASVPLLLLACCGTMAWAAHNNQSTCRAYRVSDSVPQSV